MMFTNSGSGAPAGTGAPRPANNAYSVLPQTGTGKKTNKSQTGKSQYYLYDEELEKAVLGGILLSKGEFLSEITQIISVRDFAFPANALIFQALTVFHEKGTAIDILTLTNYLQEKGKIDKLPGQNLYIVDLIEHIAAPSTAIQHAKKIKELSAKRQMSLIAQSISNNISANNIIDTINKAKQKLERLEKELEQNTTNELSKYIIKPDVNKKELDYFVKLKEDPRCGALEGTSFVLAARGGLGKSCFAVQFACYLSVGLDVLFLSPAKESCRSLIFAYEDVEVADKKTDTEHTLEVVTRYLSQKYQQYDFDTLYNHLANNVLIANNELKEMLEDCFEYKGSNVKLRKDIVDKIVNMCLKAQINLIIIDPIASLINARDNAREFMKLCRKFNEKGINTLLLSHLNKNTKAEDIDRIYGGVEIVNLNRLVLHLDLHEVGYYCFKILKGNKVSESYINKEYICKKNSQFWQIFEEIEEDVINTSQSAENTNKKNRGRRRV